MRGEGDTDGDGRIDRWEYFDANAQLVRVGSSSRNDGIEDTWTLVQAKEGTSEIDRSRTRDRHIDRREFFTGEVLVRAEEVPWRGAGAPGAPGDRGGAEGGAGAVVGTVPALTGQRP